MHHDIDRQRNYRDLPSIIQQRHGRKKSMIERHAMRSCDVKSIRYHAGSDVRGKLFVTGHRRERRSSTSRAAASRPPAGRSAMS